MENLKTLQAEIDELTLLEDELERRNALNKISVFAKRYLPHYITKEFGNFHQDLFKHFESPSLNKRVAIASPRGTGKSVLVSTVFPLWVICTKRKKYIIIISESSDLSEQWLACITRELESNERLIKDFGNLVGVDKWNDSEIETSTGIKVKAKGASSAIRGARHYESRPDLVINDDVVGESNSSTENTRLNLEEWFERTVLNLSGGYPCDYFLIGTIFHGEDLLSKHIKKWNGKIYNIVNEDGNLLWEAMYGEDWVENKKKDDPLAFSAEYMNAPVSYKDSKLSKEQIGYYDIEDIIEKPVKLLFGIDPAQSKKNQSDYSAIVCIAEVENTFTLYVVDCLAKHIGYKELIEDIFNFVISCVNLFKNGVVEQLLFEDNAFQYIIREEFTRISLERGLFLPAKGIRNIINKNLRISSIYPAIEAKNILFRKILNQNQLINQLLLFPHSGHDDLADGLATAVNFVKGKARNTCKIVMCDVITVDKADDDIEDERKDFILDSNGQFIREIGIIG